MQEGLNLPDSDWRKVKEPADDKPENEIRKFREAIDIFLRFLLGEGGDSCPAVIGIEPVAS
jgi:hypothetical protein